MTNGTDWEAGPSRASFTVPLRVRLIGRPSDAVLSRLEDLISRAVARRIITARRTVSSLHARPQTVFGRRPAAKRKKKRVPIRRPPRHAPPPAAKVDPLDRAEFELFKFDPTTGRHLKRVTVATGTVGAYLAQRRRTFKDDPAHPDDAYWAFAKESDAELAANPALRRVLEFGRQPKSQTVFYRWVRKAYIDWVGREHLDPDIARDIPGIILRAERRAQFLKDLVKREGIAAYGLKRWGEMRLSIQGFNPRPEKGGGRFRLGTLSEHAFGAAVDIEPDHNPQLSLAQWRWIESVAGRKLPVDRDPERWRTDPKSFWQDIKDLNDAFVEEIARRIKAEEDRRRIAEWASHVHLDPAGPPELTLKIPAPVPGISLRTHLTLELPPSAAPHLIERRPAPPLGLRLVGPSPVDVVFKGHGDLMPYRSGFFTLDWELVERLHDQGLVWGASFKPPSRVDLHHFQLPEGTVQGEEESHAREIREWSNLLQVPQLQGPPPPDLQLPPPELLLPKARRPFHLLHLDLPPPESPK